MERPSFRVDLVVCAAVIALGCIVGGWLAGRHGAYAPVGTKAHGNDVVYMLDTRTGVEGVAH